MTLRKNAPVGIMFGLDKELRRYLDRVHHRGNHAAAGLEIIEGDLAGHRVLLTNAGIGKVNASLAATLLCDRFGCGLIVFPGLAGGLAPEVRRHMVVATELIQHDHGDWIDGKFRLTQPSPPPVLPKAGRGFVLSPVIERIARETAAAFSSEQRNLAMQIHFGRVISGDIFVLCPATRHRLSAEHNALALDMEGAALAQVAEPFGREHLVVRVLSDLAGAAHQLNEQTKLMRLDAAADFVQVFLTARRGATQ
jgi:adenosylhomocysteine nucleosidase